MGEPPKSQARRLSEGLYPGRISIAYALGFDQPQLHIASLEQTDPGRTSDGV